MTGTLTFAAASFLAFVIASAVSVFALGQIERGWGAGGSFQVLCMASAVATLLLLVGFGLGAAIRRRVPNWPTSAVLGAACAMLFVATLAIASALGADPAESLVLLVALPVLGAVSTLIRQAAPRPETAQS